VKEECLSKFILFGEGSLRRALEEFEAHYHEERNHQGKGNVLLFPCGEGPTTKQGPWIRCHERLGGLLKYYHRKAAWGFWLYGSWRNGCAARVGTMRSSDRQPAWRFITSSACFPSCLLFLVLLDKFASGGSIGSNLRDTLLGAFQQILPWKRRRQWRKPLLN